MTQVQSQCQCIHAVGMTAQHGIGLRQVLGLFEAGMRNVLGDQFFDGSSIQVAVLAFGHAFQTWLQLLPLGFQIAVLLGQSLSDSLEAIALFTRIGTGLRFKF